MSWISGDVATSLTHSENCVLMPPLKSPLNQILRTNSSLKGGVFPNESVRGNTPWHDLFNQ